MGCIQKVFWLGVSDPPAGHSRGLHGYTQWSVHLWKRWKLCPSVLVHPIQCIKLLILELGNSGWLLNMLIFFGTTTLGTIQRSDSCNWTWWFGLSLQPGVFWASQFAAREIHPPVVWGSKLYLRCDGIHELLKGKSFGPLQLWFSPCQVVDPSPRCWQSQNTRVNFHRFHIKARRKPGLHHILRVLWYILHDLNIHPRGNIFIQCLVCLELRRVCSQALSHHAEAHAWRSWATISVDYNPDFNRCNVVAMLHNESSVAGSIYF